MVKAIRVHEHGGPEVLRWEEVEMGEPGEGEIRMKNTAIGVNFVDVYMRKGVFRVLPSLPFTLGVESVGVVTAVGPGTAGVGVGDAVGCPMAMGAYAEERIVPAAAAIPIPEWVDHKTAAAVMVKGLTARMLVREAFRVEAGHTVLVHVAAGGVGSLVCQWASALGATVIGAVSSETSTAAQACLNVCHHVVVYAGAQEEEEDFVGKVKAIAAGTGGGDGGVDVVYDGVGKETWRASLACLAPRGCLVWFGESSGAPEPVAPRDLKARSLSVTCPSLRSYVATREALLAAAGEVWKKVASGVLRTPVGHVYPLAEAARAHADMEGRRTSGSVVLVPSV
ncbi:hypothetical protein ACP70R_002373 [Stipagrostis hirtigluma subsp. patula]